MTRRILATRNAGWARACAHRLADAGVQPNTVSLAGIAFALGAFAAFCLAPGVPRGARVIVLVLAAGAIQLRLLCNLLDGMLAVEEGLKTKTGEIYNDLPDRIADIIILAGAGYATRALPYGETLGWIAASLAVFTAYVRLLGGSLGVAQPFVGPMAKPHRMFTLTVATLISAAETAVALPPIAMRTGLAVIAAGSIVTIVRRTRLIAGEVGAR
jgi:phosphatidylglycerophosphate synthase